MTKEEKNQLISDLAEQLNTQPVVYLADTANLNAADTSKLRRLASQRSVKLRVVKNTLLKKAMEKSDKEFTEMYEVLVGNTSLMFSDTGNVPARLIEEFRKKSDKPLLKGAWVEESVYIGDDQLKSLVDLKSKEELVGEIIGLLQSPAKNVISALNSGKSTLAGLVKTLSERAEA